MLMVHIEYLNVYFSFSGAVAYIICFNAHFLLRFFIQCNVNTFHELLELNPCLPEIIILYFVGSLKDFSSN